MTKVSNELEQVAREIVMPLARKEAMTAYDVAAKMPGGKTQQNIRAADDIMRKMHGEYREADGLTWVYSSVGGKLHGSWLKKTRTDGR